MSGRSRSEGEIRSVEEQQGIVLPVDPSVLGRKRWNRLLAMIVGGCLLGMVLGAVLIGGMLGALIGLVVVVCVIASCLGGLAA